ncbi:MAG: hypothetical protein ABW252_18485 [Polyangiales bacterium]
MPLLRHSSAVLAAFALTSFSWLASAHAEPPPKKLAFYYGFPSAVNGAAGDVAKAASVFADYDVVVFGAALEFPQYIGAPGQQPDFGCDQNSHYDHEKTLEIIQQLQPPHGKTRVFGYVSVGGENTYRTCVPNGPPVPLTLDEMRAAIDGWSAMGVTGVFFDEAEYGFGSTREVQNQMSDYAHGRGMRVFINGFIPHDVFSDQRLDRVTYSGGYHAGKLSSAPMNPNGTPARLGPEDIYLLEHYQVINGNYADTNIWVQRADAAAHYRTRYGTQIATVTTQADPFPAPAQCAGLWDQTKYDYAWWSTFLYGFEYVSWGEPSGFSAWGTCVNTLLPHAGPVLPDVGTFTSPVIHPMGAGSTVHARRTTLGTIEVNTGLHMGRFTPDTAWR